MSELNTAFEVWSTIKDELKNPADAAAEVVNCLIDNLGYSSELIMASDFITDPDIKTALSDFDILHPEDEGEEDEGLDEWGDEIDDDDDWKDKDDY